MGKKKRAAEPVEPVSLVEVLRGEIEASGLTDYALSKLSGVAIPVLSRFRRGERDNITLTTASKIAAALGLELRRAD